MENNETKVTEIFIPEGTEVIKKKTYCGPDDVIIHIPNSVRVIEEQAIFPSRQNNVEVFYNGTKEEWDDIRKGHLEYWSEEDYHRIGMGVSRGYFVDWAVYSYKITIHCLDGDIITKDSSYRDY